MKITEKDATDKTLFDLLYELCRKAGLDDTKACDTAEALQGDVWRAINRAGGDADLIPEE